MCPDHRVERHPSLQLSYTHDIVSSPSSYRYRCKSTVLEPKHQSILLMRQKEHLPDTRVQLATEKKGARKVFFFHSCDMVLS